MDEQIELLREMRDLLRVIAEPVLEKRDKEQRSSLSEIVGSGKVKARAILLMDGSRNQASICKESGIDSGGLSRLVKALRGKELITADDKRLKLLLTIPPNFFENLGKNHG